MQSLVSLLVPKRSMTIPPTCEPCAQVATMCLFEKSHTREGVRGC